MFTFLGLVCGVGARSNLVPSGFTMFVGVFGLVWRFWVCCVFGLFCVLLICVLVLDVVLGLIAFVISGYFAGFGYGYFGVWLFCGLVFFRILLRLLFSGSLYNT